jgi:hypothetical protein
MADKVLRNKIIRGRVTLPPEGLDSTDTWKPFEISNDFYPKIVSQLKDEDLDTSTFVIYEQKNVFKELEIPASQIIIEPIVAGWGISYQDITLTFNKTKYVIYNESVQDKNVKFDDSFYRFSSMYTFEDKIHATGDDKLPFLIKSWKYRK